MIGHRDGEHERYTEGMDPLRRYYNDIEYKTGHYGDLLIATEKLLEGYVGSGNNTAANILATSEVFPSERAFENMSTRELHERLTVFPLEDITSIVETGTSLVDIREWYDSLIDKIITRTSKNHSNACLTHVGVGDGFRSCQSSMFCPWQYATYQLRKDIIRPDFSRPAYQVGLAGMTAAIAESKINLSVKHGLTQPEHAESLKRTYWYKHFEAIGASESMF